MVLLYSLNIAAPRDANADTACGYHPGSLGHSTPRCGPPPAHPRPVVGIGWGDYVVWNFRVLRFTMLMVILEFGRETEKPFAPALLFHRSKDKSFREEVVFAKGHASTEIGTAANYGCQTQLGYQGELLICSFVINHLSPNSLKGSPKSHPMSLTLCRDRTLP